MGFAKGYRRHRPMKRRMVNVIDVWNGNAVVATFMTTDEAIKALQAMAQETKQGEDGEPRFRYTLAPCRRDMPDRGGCDPNLTQVQKRIGEDQPSSRRPSERRDTLCGRSAGGCGSMVSPRKKCSKRLGTHAARPSSSAGVAWQDGSPTSRYRRW
jgi:hypothetical protein